MKTLFVSSTYLDMDGEREILHRQVLPNLKETARGFGRDVELSDIRWGKPGCELDSELGCRRLLSVCFDEIDRCEGHMIVLVGQRYGRIAGAELVKQTAQRENLTLSDLEQSVTALELEYGVFARKDWRRKVLFYFREVDGDTVPGFCRPESALHSKRLGELKERIRNLAGDRVRTYHVRWDEKRNVFTGLEDFAKMVEEDVRALLQLQGEQTVRQTPEQRDLRCQWELAHQRVREYSGGSALVSRVMRTVEDSRTPLVLRGSVGSGKSTLMGKLAQEFERRGHMVLPIFCGKTELCRTEEDVLRYMLRSVGEMLNDSPQTEDCDGQCRGVKDCRQRLSALLERYGQQCEENLVFLLDGTDRLLPGTAAGEESFLPDKLPERVKIIATCADRSGLPAGAEEFLLTPPEGAEIMEMARGILRATGCELEEPVLAAIGQKPEAQNPLYLNLLLRRLALMENEDSRRGVQPAERLRVIDSAQKDVKALFIDVLAAVSALLNNTIAVHAGIFLAISRYGLRESDLEGIFARDRLPWDALSIARCRKYLGRLLFQRNDGRIDYRHHTLREAMVSYLKSPKVLHRTVMRYLLSLPAGDPVRGAETVWHALQAQEYGSYVDYIESLDEQSADLTAAAGETALMLTESGGGWLLDILDMGMDYGCGQRFLAFLGEPLALALGNEEKELLLHRDILLSAVRLAESRAEKLATEESRKTAIACRNRAGRACYRLGDGESLAMVTEMQEKQLSVAESVLAGENTPAGRRKLMSAYSEVAGFYEKQGGTDQKRKALALHEKRLLQWLLLTEQEGQWDSAPALAEEFDQYAGVYAQLGTPEDGEKAKRFREKALEVRAMVAEKATEPTVRKAALRQVAGEILSITGSERGRERALKLLERLQCSQAEPSLDEDCREDGAERASVYFALGQVYGLSQGREDLLRALESYQQSFLLRRELSKLYTTAESRMELALCYERMGEIYCLLGGGDNLHRALELLNRGLSLRRKLHAKLNTAESALALAVSLHQMGKLCAAFGGERNLRQAKDILESALPLHQPAEETGSDGEVSPERQALILTLAEVKAALAELEAQRAREDEERRLAQIRLEEEELAREAEENAQAEDGTEDDKED